MLKCGGIKVGTECLAERADLSSVQRRIEIAELDILEFIADLRDQSPDSQLPFAKVRTHLFEVPAGVDVEVSHLNQIKAGFGYELSEGIPFAFLVCKSRKNEVIDGRKSAVCFHNGDGALCVLEGVTLRAEVFLIILGPRAVHADADALKTGAAELFDIFRKTSVCVEVYRASACGPADHGDGGFKSFSLQQRLSLAALPEAHHCARGLLQMRDCDAAYLIGRGHEGYAVLGWADSGPVLAADAADTPGVALGGGRKRGLPAVHEQVSCCGAAVGKSASCEVLHEPVLPLGFHASARVLLDCFRIEIAEILPLVPVDPYRWNDKASI